LIDITNSNVEEDTRVAVRIRPIYPEPLDARLHDIHARSLFDDIHLLHSTSIIRKVGRSIHRINV
jgi:hypothetical protein